MTKVTHSSVAVDCDVFHASFDSSRTPRGSCARWRVAPLERNVHALRPYGAFVCIAPSVLGS